jgi:hypothetical protein
MPCDFIWQDNRVYLQLRISEIKRFDWPTAPNFFLWEDFQEKLGCKYALIRICHKYIFKILTKFIGCHIALEILNITKNMVP